MDRNWIILPLLVLIGGLWWVNTPAFAQDDDSAEEESSVGEIIENVGELPGAIEAIKQSEDKTVRAMAVCGLIAIILKIVLSVFKLIPAAIFKNKIFLKIFPLGVGLAVFLLTSFAAGEEWYNALLMAAGGPGAILFHEIWKLVPVAQDKKG